MVALFGDSQPATAFSFPMATPPNRPAMIGTPVNRAADGCEPPLGPARLGDILPQLLERYGLNEASETNRPDLARGRRRVG